MKRQPKQRRPQRGFTLIELLVVIAIVAILASLLFPVFAQAKEAAKKTEAISNVKQTSLATLMYSIDHDDLFPNTYPITNHPEYGRIWWIGYSYQVPAYWLKVDDPWPEGQQWQIWANSIQPYAKSFDMMTVQTTDRRYYWDLDYQNVNAQPKSVPLTINGLLNSYPASSVADPSRLTLVWTGNYREDMMGYARANPQLACLAFGVDTCVFNPNTEPHPGGYGFGDLLFSPFYPETFSPWVVGKGMVFAHVDGSVKWRAMVPGLGSNSDADSRVDRVATYGDPASMYYTPPGQGFPSPFDFHRCRAEGSSVYYLSFFRPDSTFEYEFGSADVDARCFPSGF